ncbi:thioredoxin family protein [Methanosarcina horonobensis]|uniref:thioredoxin family protein n=1 Tax=Methanosarcina horonobensis TaxID=418008 RepID=UPI000A5D5C16|nr:thioredoxin family protein [Methanosarcina horonobensis]
MVEVTNLSQIDQALNKGPVVLKLGSKGCIPCQEQEEVLSELLPMYQNSASIMLIDIKEHPEFAATFGVRVIPDTCIIAGIEDGKYMYMRPDGSKSSERQVQGSWVLPIKKPFHKLLRKLSNSEV